MVVATNGRQALAHSINKGAEAAIFLGACTPAEGAIAFATPDNPTGMFLRVEVVTPERAAQLLATAPRHLQRGKRSHRIAQYARNREQGQWRLHHQGIAIDCNGILRDGQHRMEMVVKTGLPTAMVIAYNVPEDGILHADEQLPRSVRDAIRMAQHGDFSASMIATFNCYVCFPLASDRALRPTKEEIVNGLTQNASPLGFAEDLLVKLTGITRGVRAAVARAWHHVDRDRLREFCEIMQSGMPVSSDRDDDSAAIVLRNFLLSTRDAGQALEMERYRKAQSAIDHFCKRQRMTKLYGSEKDLYPLPDGAGA